MFDYDAEDDDELSLRKGEIVEVLDQKKDGWWQGSLHGKEGLFPFNFVQLEKGSISISKFQPTSVPIAPASEEPGEFLLWIMQPVHIHMSHLYFTIKNVS